MFNMIAPHVVGVEEGAGHANMSVRRVLSADKTRTKSEDSDAEGSLGLGAVKAGAEAEEEKGMGQQNEGLSGACEGEDEGETKEVGTGFDPDVCPPCDPGPMITAEVDDEFADVEVRVSVQGQGQGQGQVGVPVGYGLTF
jgi:hypothetical protein